MRSVVTDAQEEIFALLADPATHGSGAVRRIDTHAAAVFLAGERAYKIKRAVVFPFLDYSTIAKRKAACEAELRVNRPFAPDIYLRVVAITREDGRLALDGPGEPVEWAVEMRRFDENMTLDHLADERKIEGDLADALARAVAAAHERAPVVEAEPWLDALGRFIGQNDAALRERPQIFPSSDVEELTKTSRMALDRLRPLLRARGAQRLVRRGHGDLHLGNIALIDGKPVPFDAIEFDPLIATGDVLYDLAFLLMDLVERGLGASANIVFNRYLLCTQRAEDLDALAALPFFLSMRAAIRAKVTAARLKQADPEKQPEIRRNARRYFDWAGCFIEPAPPVLVAIGGLSGTGKSVVARALAPSLAPAPGAVVLRTDIERKALFGKEEAEPLAREAYEPAVTARVYDAVVEKARRALAAGHSAVVDAVFAKLQERVAVEQAAAALGVPFHGLFLETALATRVARVGSRDRDASDADAAIARAQESYDLGDLTWSRIDASGTPEQTLARAKAVMKGNA